MTISNRYSLCTNTAVFLCLLVILSVTGNIRAAEQYIVVNIAPGEVKEEVFKEIGQLASDKGSGRAGLGIGAIFSYLNQPREQCQALLKHFLALAERFNMPVVVQLDGEQWWGNRPDLWN